MRHVRHLSVLVVLGSFSQSAYAQVVDDDPVQAMMIASGRPSGMPLAEERLSVAIDGQHATTTLLQVYDNQTGAQVEGRYALRAGTGSHVEGFAYWNGEQKIVGEVFEKQTAEMVYDRVTTRRRDPALLVQDGEGAFSFKVFPIAPKEKKRVELEWSRWLPQHTGTVTYRAPITRDDAAIVLTIAGNVKGLSSPTHVLHVEKTGDGVRIRADGARGKREVVVEWNVDAPAWQPAVYVQPGGANNKTGDGWFAAELAAPRPDAGSIAAKDVTIVIDRSGSMEGEAIEHARVAAADMIRALDSRDRINVIAFSDEVDTLFAAPQPLDADARKRAVEFAQKLRPGGGTDIALALQTAISAQEKKSERPRVVVFMTDGQSDVDRSLKAAQADTGDIRVFTVGLGKDVNRPLLERIAATKRGRFQNIDTAADIEREVARLGASIAKPMLVDVSVRVEGANAVRLYPRSIPDLFADDELVVTGRIRGTGTAKVIFEGVLGGKRVSFARSISLDAKQPQRPWVGRLWAQSRVDHLLEELSLGTKEEKEMKDELIELALAYNFVTPYTAFLAIPESELGEMRGTVEAARKQKAKILADNQDAASLRTGATTATALDVDGDVEGVAPGDAVGGEEDEADEAPASYGKVHGHGCAGCATGGGGPQAGLFVICVAVLLLRRRRA